MYINSKVNVTKSESWPMISSSGFVDVEIESIMQPTAFS